MPDTTVLSTGYHLENFTTLLATVEQTYSDLLTPQEQHFLNSFKALPTLAQNLYVRLIMRKGPYFRKDKLNYSELGAIGPLLETLEEHNLVELNPLDNPTACLKLLLKHELISLFPNLPVLPNCKRADLEHQLLMGEVYNFASITQILSENIHWCAPLQTNIITLFKLLFFGNTHQDLTEFVVSDLGVVRFEKYVIDSDHRFFNSRDRLESLLIISQVKERFYENTKAHSQADLQQFAEQLSAPEIDTCAALDDYVARKQGQALNLIARQLERLKEGSLALEIYQRSQEPPSKERQARLLAQANNIAQVYSLCQSMQSPDATPEEQIFAAEFQQRIAKKTGTPPPAYQPPIHQPRMLSLTLPQQQTRVELDVCAHYENQGYETFFLENLLFNGLLGIWFWEIIFAPAVDAFFNPYQRGPRDLFSPEFARKRQTQIMARLEALNDDHWQDSLLTLAQKKRGIANHLVTWEALPNDVITRLAHILPVSDVRTVFTQMLRHLGYYRSGFPDLLIYREDKGYQFVEVKGPGDTLQKNQKQWLSFFQQHNIPAVVAQIAWLDKLGGLKS